MKLQWFPGHMKKSFRDLEDSLKKIDMVMCVLDARAPFSCINPMLEKIVSGKPICYCFNKVDMANERETKAWVARFRREGKTVIELDARKSTSKKLALDAINECLIQRQKKRIVTKFRVAIVGVPNTGKSTLLNTLAGSYLAKTGNLAGVTRSSAWIKIKNNIELMDNAGTLYPKFDDENIAENLAILGSINDAVVDMGELSIVLLKKLKQIAPELLKKRYNLSEIKDDDIECLEDIARSRGFVVRGGDVDYERASLSIIDDFRKGKIGRITLESA